MPTKPSRNVKDIIKRLKRDLGYLADEAKQEGKDAVQSLKEESQKIVDQGLNDMVTMLRTTAKDLDAFNKKRKSAKKPGTLSAPDQPSK
jgi:hypothetical protein